MWRSVPRKSVSKFAWKSTSNTHTLEGKKALYLFSLSSGEQNYLDKRLLVIGRIKYCHFSLHVKFNNLCLYWSSDPCQAANCKHHSVCEVKPDGSTACECPRAEECPDVNDPVCGTNGETYESECKLMAESCAEGIDVTTKHNGVCGMKITSKNMLSLTCFLYPIIQV